MSIQYCDVLKGECCREGLNYKSTPNLREYNFRSPKKTWPTQCGFHALLIITMHGQPFFMTILKNNLIQVVYMTVLQGKM